MTDVIVVKGKVKFSITLDPSIWIFDDRKKSLKDFFANEESTSFNNREEELSKMGKYWDNELFKPVDPKQPVFFAEKKKIEGDYGIALWPFLNNAEPLKEAQYVVFKNEEGEEIRLSLEEAHNAIFCFAIDGKPIREQGPVHFYYGNGQNKENPFKGITSIIVE